jgi:ferritin-like metal-binding protein YciE
MPAETNRDEKLVQYLGEAYGKEKELETALEAHIGMTDRAPYKKRLRQHLRETKNHGRLVERRIKQLAGRGMAMAKGPLHALRGKSDEEKLLKNAKSEYSDEAEEIATYMAIETLAQTVGDKETAQVARQIRREEERMAAFLERQIPVLARAAARAEIPASERGARTRRPSRRTATRRGGRSRTRARSGRTRARSGRARSRS